MVTFVELRNLRSPYRHPLQITFSEALYKRMKDTGYYPDYVNIDDYIRHNDHIVGGWINALSSHLKEFSCSVEWFSNSQPLSRDEDGIYLISVMTAMYGMARKAVSHIKNEQPDAAVIVGGVHPTLKPVETLKDLGADYVVLGEADHTINSIIHAVKNNEAVTVPGVYYKRGNEAVFTGEPQLPEITDIQIDWGLHIQYSHPVLKSIPNIYTTRDCPYRCNFCSIIKRRKFRQLPVDTVIKNIKTLQEELDGRPLHLLVEDPTFLANLKYARKFVDEMSNLTDVSWVCDTRIDIPQESTQKIFKKMAESGCEHVFFGVESSLQHVLDNMNKGIRADHIIPFLKCARESGIHTHTGWIVGFPNQKREDVEQDIQFILDGIEEGYISTANLRFLIIYPGSLYEQRKEHFGISLHYTKESYDTIEQEVTHSTSYLSREEIWELYLWGLEKILAST